MKKLILLAMALGLGFVGNSFAAETNTAGFNYSHVKENAYWYSRYNLGNLVMRSGLGETFKPTPGMPAMLVEMVSDNTSTAKPPQNPALIKRVYNSGSPLWVNSSNRNGTDFINFRWGAALDDRTSAAAYAWTATKEIEWSKQFNVDLHFGAPNDGLEIPGAQQRFSGVVLCAESLVQTKEFLTNRAAFDMSDVGGQYAALITLSNLAKFVGTSSNDLMEDNRCAKVASMMNKKPAADVATDLLASATKFYNEIAEPALDNERELSLAIQGLTWFAAANKELRTEVIAKIDTYGKALGKIKTTFPVGHAYKIRGLIEATRMTGKSSHMRKAARVFTKELAVDFNVETGIFKSQTTYTTDDVAVILGALNALRIFASDSVGDLQAKDSVLVIFFKNVVNESGLQISAPPISFIPAYERSEADPMLHRYPTLPVPPKAGGANGTAPVFAASVTFDANTGWSADKTTFDTAGAMHLANEMMWFHNNEVNGFPTLD